MLVKVIIFPVMYSFANDSAFCASITRTTQKSFLEFGENRAPYLPYSIESVPEIAVGPVRDRSPVLNMGLVP